jgi:hypothetical protein
VASSSANDASSRKASDQSAKYRSIGTIPQWPSAIGLGTP